jgi:hypothetical protein
MIGVRSSAMTLFATPELVILCGLALAGAIRTELN